MFRFVAGGYRSVFQWAMAPLIAAPMALLLLLVAGCSALSSGDNPIVYVSDEDGDREIYLLDPKTGESSRLTSNRSPDEGPRWSADGRQIAYVSRESGDKEINVIERGGKGLRRLTNNPGLDGSPRWSPTEPIIAYVSESADEAAQESDIFTISPEDRIVDQITFDPPTEELGDWSPDGEWIIFYNAKPAADQGLWLRNPTGVNLQQLTNQQDSDPVWSPDGKRIAFVRQQEDSQVIYSAWPSNGDSWGDGIEESRLTYGGFDDHSPTWRPDGKTLAFVSSRDGNQEIYTMRADGANQARLTSNNVDDVAPVWSPNGEQLAFVSYLYGSADILVMDEDGTNQRRLTKNEGDDLSPDW